MWRYADGGTFNGAEVLFLSTDCSQGNCSPTENGRNLLVSRNASEVSKVRQWLNIQLLLTFLANILRSVILDIIHYFTLMSSKLTFLTLFLLKLYIIFVNYVYIIFIFLCKFLCQRGNVWLVSLVQTLVTWPNSQRVKYALLLLIQIVFW